MALCRCGCGRPTRKVVTSDNHVYWTKYHSPECYPKNAGRIRDVVKTLCKCGCGREFETKSLNRLYYSNECKEREYARVNEELHGSEAPFCLCGCGQKVRYYKGRYNKYIQNHYTGTGSLEKAQNMHKILRESREEVNKKISESQKRRYSDPEIKAGMVQRLSQYRRKRRDIGQPPLCACGCGKPVSRKGNKYVAGHYGELLKKEKMLRLGEAPYCKCGCGNRVTLHNKGQRWNEYFGTHYTKDPDYRRKMSDVMNSSDKKVELSEKGKELYKDPIFVEKLQKSMNKRPNGFESLFEQLKPDMFIKYVGDFKLWITLGNGKPKNPDFIIEGTNKVIELHGDYWHKGEDSNELVKLYKSVGYDCLVIWESEMSDIQSVMKRVSDFLKK